MKKYVKFKGKKLWLSIEDLKDIISILEVQETTDRDTEGSFIWMDGSKTICYYVNKDCDIVITELKNEKHYINNYQNV